MLTSDIQSAQPIALSNIQDGPREVRDFSGIGNLSAQELINLEPQLLAQQQQSKVALVIGNEAYEHAPLTNPVNDATAIHQTLDELGFDMLPLVANADEQEMAEAIRDFRNRLEAGAVGVFYYAGHGVQVDGKNYLVPIDADLEYEFEVESEAIDLDRVMRAMDDANTQFNVLIIDACRDNPFYRRWRRRDRTFRTRGLANPSPPRGTLIAYATEPGDVAADGYGNQHSPFTQGLLKHLRTPGLNIRIMLDRVASDVLEATNQEQFPWTEGNLIGDFSFNPQEAYVPIALPPEERAEPLADIDLRPDVEADANGSFTIDLGPLSEERLERLPPLTSNSNPDSSNDSEPLLPYVISFEPDSHLGTSSSPSQTPTSTSSLPETESNSRQSTETSLDLTQLQSFAQAGNWREADAETRQLIRQLGNVETLDCSELRAIDQEWVNASNGHFGFSVQVQIWQEAGSPWIWDWAPTSEFYEELAKWEKFGELVGWREDNEWVSQRYNPNTPRGHLPALPAEGTGRRFWSNFDIALRYAKCNTQ